VAVWQGQRHRLVLVYVPLNWLLDIFENRESKINKIRLLINCSRQLEKSGNGPSLPFGTMEGNKMIKDR